MLPVSDSNTDSQIQSLESYLLDEPGMAARHYTSLAAPLLATVFAVYFAHHRWGFGYGS